MMHIYDTLIIGSGYASAGYALARENCMICEQNEICDTHFYLPMKQFGYSDYMPMTEQGRELKQIFSDLGLFGEKLQNVNGFESGFCTFLSQKEIDIRLKCRVVDSKCCADGVNRVTLISNSGLETVYAKKILDTCNEALFKRKCLTILVSTEDINNLEAVFQDVFPGSYWEKAFYEGRYALYIPVEETEDVNLLKLMIYQKWKMYGINAKILYIAPVIGMHMGEGVNENGSTDSLPCDDMFGNPIEAFEAGFNYGVKER